MVKEEKKMIVNGSPSKVNFSLSVELLNALGYE